MAREREADNTPAKPMDDLQYITIPWEELPVQALPEDPEVQDALEIIGNLRDAKIVNLTGFSNTDLKLRYGAPNIFRLMSWDQNYTVLARTLQKWGARLMDKGLTEEGVQVLEFALKTRTDVYGTYERLNGYYQEKGMEEKRQGMIRTAEGLESMRKEQILGMLR
ncbi:MAG: hypothetical protein IJU50_10310 [Lachnospiraceae bacterium]|nr:hypothetical protein [Lachnospiraceae bacterium]